MTANDDYIEQLEAAFIDVLDGNSKWYDILDSTGLSEGRSKEISEFYNKVVENYHKRHNINQ